MNGEGIFVMKQERRIGVLFLVMAVLLFNGCCKGKNYEKLSQEQAQVIASLNQELTQLKGELEGLKRAKAQEATPGTFATTTSTKSQFVK